jgi:hypothetical protein
VVDDLHLERAQAARASTPNHARKVSATGWRRRACTGPGGERECGNQGMGEAAPEHKVSERGRIPATIIIQEYQASP